MGTRRDCATIHVAMELGDSLREEEGREHEGLPRLETRSTGSSSRMPFHLPNIADSHGVDWQASPT